MSIPFDPREDLIYIWAEIAGPRGKARLRLALDTGATATVIGQTPFKQLGYALETGGRLSQIITGSRSETAAIMRLSRMSVLGQDREDFEVYAYDLPAATGIDGVLGLDFLRVQSLNIDFRKGLITFT